VHAAIGLTVAESLLLGCQPIVVEGPSDQYYLSAIKNYLVAAGTAKPGRELVFPPAGGAKGVKVLASVLGANGDTLPFVLMDSDEQGARMAQVLRGDLYSGATDRVLEVGDYVDVKGAEVEDLMPPDILVHELDRWQRAAETPFAETYKIGAAIVPQIERWAAEQKLRLDLGWKVELAKRTKANLLKRNTALPVDIVARWSKLLGRITAHDTQRTS
jgi:5S rRNA maturation endonuclease (ribonuclease M5)